MTPVLITVGVLVLAPVIYVVAIYNRLVNLNYLIRNAWSNIDTELKRRYDLVPNLVETVKGYAAHEKEVLENVTEARANAVASTGSPASQARDVRPDGCGPSWPRRAPGASRRLRRRASPCGAAPCGP